MSKEIDHIGMTITEDEFEKWHREPRGITPEEHDAMMKKMGISEEEDRAWHKIHGKPEELSKYPGYRSVNPFAIGGGFLNYCIKQGWIIQEGKKRNAKYYVTEEGAKELNKFEIKV